MYDNLLNQLTDRINSEDTFTTEKKAEINKKIFDLRALLVVPPSSQESKQLNFIENFETKYPTITFCTRN